MRKLILRVLFVAFMVLGLVGFWAYGFMSSAIVRLYSDVELFDVVRIMLSLVIIAYCVLFGVFGYSLAKRMGKNPLLWGWVCGLTGLWGWLYLYIKRNRTG